MALPSPQIPEDVDAFVEEIKQLISGLEYEIEWETGSRIRLLSDLRALVNSDYFKYVMDKDTRAQFGDTVPCYPDDGEFVESCKGLEKDKHHVRMYIDIYKRYVDARQNK
ncbi:hypothetical protein DFA_02859 [Cavenderia fasciculata]|uniref:Uncharacterized protein n=1 Tax=Cavenderia fasciculata TaxID=261658 RepID=F4PIN6_CACFS|nr:uncharacterized protein DFA_02859 [Cavenderia fasciculata]EGG24616.1 hypothetical protein DFA_02859 [Cavenderia fasciculata]|eukprot:XP_004362467.1 hypothetical protein DFA_02859 [Cavenderia fasciculata]